MAAIDFPTATSNGQTFEADSGVIYTYVGTPPNGFWSGTFGTTGLTTLDGRYIAKNDGNTLQTIQTQGLKFNSGSSDTILLDGLNGNVSIGTATPLTSSGFNGVTASGSTGGIYWFAKAGAQKGYLSGSDNDVTLASTDASGVIRLLTGGNNERMRIDSSGNVGIGTTSPGYNLHIHETAANTESYLKITSAFVGSTASDGMLVGVTMSGDTILWNQENTATLFGTNNTERMRIDSSGNVGIGTTSAQANLDISPESSSASLRVQARTNTSPESSIELVRGTAQAFGADVYQDFRIKNSVGELIVEYGQSGLTSEALRVDSVGRLLVGTSSARSNVNGGAPPLQIETASNSSSTGLSIINNSNVGYTSRIALGLTRGTSVGSSTIVTNNDSVGYLSWVGSDGSDFIEAARIECQIDGTPGSNDMPGRLVFSTTADGASSPTERLRIDNTGLVTIDSFTNTAGGISLRSGFAPTAFGGSGIMATDHSGSSRDGMALYGHDGISFHINGPSERMRIDGQGTARVLIGTISAIGGLTKDSYYSKLTVVGRGDAPSNEGRVSIVRDTTSTAHNLTVGSLYFADLTGNSYGSILCSAAANSTSTSSPGELRFYTTASGAFNPSERMRVTSDGKVLIGQTDYLFAKPQSVALNNPDGGGWAGFFCSTAGSTQSGVLALNQRTSGAWQVKCHFGASGSPVGGIVMNGSTGVLFPTSSDYRLKENIVERSDNIARFKKLRPLSFTFISEPGKIHEGFLAHEVQEVVPEAVVGVKDEIDEEGNPVHQSLDHSKLIPLLTGALQEAITKIEILEAVDHDQFQNTSALLNQPLITFLNSSGATAGEIIHSGVNSVTYATSSDYRLKENVTDLTAAIPRLKNLAPKRFNFIGADQVTVDGFLAHEAQTVVPEAVTGTYNEVDGDGNAVMQGIDQSKLVPLLTAALQEAITKIETLETKVAALEAA